MRFKADEIISVIKEQIRQPRAGAEAREVGKVLEVGDGIARVYGLSSVMAGEMVEFPPTDHRSDAIRGVAFNLEENSVGVIILGEWPDRWTWVGSAVILGAGIYIVRREAALARQAAMRATPPP